MPEPRLEGFRAGPLCVRTWERISRQSTHTVRNCVAEGVKVAAGVRCRSPSGAAPGSAPRRGRNRPPASAGGGRTGDRDGPRSARARRPAPATATGAAITSPGTAHGRLPGPVAPGPGRATEAPAAQPRRRPRNRGRFRQPRLRDQGPPGVPGCAIEVARSTRRTRRMRRAGRAAGHMMTGQPPGGRPRQTDNWASMPCGPGLTSPQTQSRDSLIAAKKAS
jgi:hypothetical protein